MTLYSRFRSKDDLILAVLQHREEQFRARFGLVMERQVAQGTERLDALLAALQEWFETPEFRGCAFINASVELADPAHPGAVHARQHKERFETFLAGLIRGLLGESAAEQTSIVALLIEGTIVTAVMQGSSRPAEPARRATAQLLRSSEGGR